MRSILTACLFFLLCHAQGQTIKGKLVDSATGKPLGLATISVFKAQDTSLITYRLSTPDGLFRVNGLQQNLPSRLIISFSGYDAIRKEFTMARDSTLDMGTIKMIPNSKTLEEVLVFAERPPVTVHKDTIEFNANSFKTLPSALVEDLLKKLPGVQVDPDGSITANGKRVNRILVDGKAFFGDDPKMATRNLPANVIDKVQVADDKEEADRNVNGDLTNVGKVINLTLKKGMKKGVFGKLYGSLGTEDRYEAGGIVNTFRDTLQLSLLAFSNNVNRSGFSFRDVQDLGGFNRSGFNSVSIMRSSSGQEGFALNGISFGGMNQGVARTTGAGFNLNHAPSKKFNFFAQYFFGNNRTFINSLSNTQQFFKDTTLNTRSTLQDTKNTFDHTVSVGSNIKPDSYTDINLRANFTYSTASDDISSLISASHSFLDTVSRSTAGKFNDVYAANYRHSASLSKRFKAKPGRTLNVSHSLSYSSNVQRYITEALNEYYYPVDYQLPFNQLRKQDVPSWNAGVSVNYAEPLSKAWTFRFNNNYGFTQDKQDIGIFDKSSSSGKYEVPGIRQSSGFTRNQHRFSSMVSLSYKHKLSTFTAGLTGVVQNISNEFRSIATPVDFHLVKLLPSFSFNRKQMSVNYSENISVPYINYLIPVPDSTNPLSIVYGNPYLRPSRSRSLYMSNFNFLQGSSTTLNYYINGTMTDDDVITSRTVAANGVQTSRPVNAGGTLRFSANIGYGKEFKNKSKFIYSFRISPYVSYNRQKVIVNNNVSYANSTQYGPSLLMRFNWHDVLEINPQYSPGFSRSRYTDPAFRNLNITTQNFENEVIVRLPKHFIWETNMAYRYNNQVAPGLPKSNFLWNGGLTYLFLKDEKGQLKLSVYDILNRNNNFYRYASQNYIIDQQTNVLKRYMLLTFTYNIRTMGAQKKVGGRDRMFMF